MAVGIWNPKFPFYIDLLPKKAKNRRNQPGIFSAFCLLLREIYGSA
jgi:hypothetical protein